VFRLESSEQANDIDVAILQSLLKAEKDKYGQLKLALTWDRIDVAKTYIFAEDKTWEVRLVPFFFPTLLSISIPQLNLFLLKEGELDDVMFSAILNGKKDFVEVFLDNGCSMNRFLTYRRLIKLYNSV
jgi:hypothetical protein